MITRDAKGKIKTAAVLLLAAATVGLLSGCGGQTQKVVIEAAAKEDYTATASPATSMASPESAAAAQDQHAKSWYGWWRMYSTSGDWKEMYGYWWDCCATLTESSDGKYTLWLWDEDVSKETGLVELTLEGDGDETKCTGGRFMDVKLDEGGCKAVIRDTAGSKLLTISGKYKDDTTGSFKYYFQLRPWGDSWDGADKDEMPYYFDSWYKPLIEAEKPMLDTIGPEKENAEK